MKELRLKTIKKGAVVEKTEREDACARTNKHAFYDLVICNRS